MVPHNTLSANILFAQKLHSSLSAARSDIVTGQEIFICGFHLNLTFLLNIKLFYCKIRKSCYFSSQSQGGAGMVHDALHEKVMFCQYLLRDSSYPPGCLSLLCCQFITKLANFPFVQLVLYF